MICRGISRESDGCACLPIFVFRAAGKNHSDSQPCRGR